MKIKYQIEKQKKIIVEIWPEFLTIEDYIDVKKRIFLNPDFNPDFDVITDLRKLKQKFEENLIQDIISFMSAHSNQIRNRKSVIIADNPHSVASAYIFKEKCRDLPVNINVFSTIEAALEWLHY